MIYGFGARCSVIQFFEPEPDDPSKPIPAAVAEMEAFDLLPAELRAKVQDSPNDVGLANHLANIRSRGAPRQVLERLRERKLLPYQVGEGGILAEIIASTMETK